jgi:hypothetical protein
LFCLGVWSFGSSWREYPAQHAVENALGERRLERSAGDHDAVRVGEVGLGQPIRHVPDLHVGPLWAASSSPGCGLWAADAIRRNIRY